MNAEFEYVVMRNHAQELRDAAATHRRVREALKGRKAERPHRSFLVRFLSS